MRQQMMLEHAILADMKENSSQENWKTGIYSKKMEQFSKDDKVAVELKSELSKMKTNLRNEASNKSNQGN